MLIIGLTGGLATGKSTVALMFKKLGAVVLDADKEVSLVWSQRPKEILKIQKILNQKIINKGGVDKRKVAGIIFKDAHKRRQVEKVLHALVKKSFEEKIRAYTRRNPRKIIILDVPLLFESGMDRMTDVTVVVKAPRELQIKRAIKRLRISRQQAVQRIKAQMPLQNKVKLADFVIDNKSRIQTTQRKVLTIWQELQQKLRK